MQVQNFKFDFALIGCPQIHILFGILKVLIVVPSYFYNSQAIYTYIDQVLILVMQILCQK